MGAITTDGDDPESVPERTESNVVNTAKDYEIVSEDVPVKRKNRARWASIVIFSITAVLVLVFCFITGKVVEYHPDTCSTQKNTTIIYIRKEKNGFPGLFTTALSLLSIVIGTLVDRFTLVVEERHHLRERYGGSRKKMIKACFSGIQKGPVISFCIITLVTVIVLIRLTDMPYFEVRYLVIIFGGIGVGPLVMHLLNLNTQSEVHISTILEEREMYVAYGLAWSYYFSYLREALPKFKEMINSSPEVTLSLNKLLLLIPLDCYTEDDLTKLDQNIKKLYDTGSDQDDFRFPVYSLKVRESEYYNLAIEYINEPLQTLDEMSNLEGIKAVRRQSCEDEVKLLCRTLSQILKRPRDQRCRETCLLVPIMAKTLEELKNGGLVNIIMKAIKSPSTHTDGASQPGCKTFGIKSFTKEEKLIVNLDSPCQSNKANKKNPQGVKTQSRDVTTYNDQRRNGENMNRDFDENNILEGKSLKRKYKEKSSEETELHQMIPAEHAMRDPFNTSHEKANDDQRKLMEQEVGEENDAGASTSGHNSQMDFTFNGNQPTDQDESFSIDDECKRLNTSQL